MILCLSLYPSQGPTISHVYNIDGGQRAAQRGFYATTICVRKKQLYASVKTLQKVRSKDGV